MALIYFADDDEDVRFSVEGALAEDGEALLEALSRKECDLLCWISRCQAWMAWRR